MSAPFGLWIPLTLFAAAAQTVRNTAQRRLIDELGTLGATLVRFLYGMPLLALWLVALLALRDFKAPHHSVGFAAWIVLSALSQMAGTALLLRAMTARSFAVGLVYSKSEVMQVALFSIVFLGERPSWIIVAAIIVATAGVVMLSPRITARPDSTTLFGLAAGTAFAISIVAYRGANLALAADSPFLAAAETLFWSQGLQALLLAGWLLARNPSVLLGALRAWRLSLFAGGAGASASLANVTALALAPASQVRTLILIEVLFTYAVSLRVFREAVSRRELAGIALVVIGAGTIVATAA
ncbi:MAG TPA: DMT family transporter [Reyranella sp.]|jgi:drug/metabolite transporter (DMT)-like permease